MREEVPISDSLAFTPFPDVSTMPIRALKEEAMAELQWTVAKRNQAEVA